ncbi:MAG: NAD-binding protein [Chloroflexi bacterium]|nr:NAD-binding protein [Chloroflexota bacterium]
MASVTVERPTGAATAPAAGNPPAEQQLSERALKVRQYTQSWLQRVQPALDWVSGTLQGSIRGLRTEFGRIVIVMAVLMVVSSNLIWLLERSDADGAYFNSNYWIGIGDALWYVIVTMATVGYGDKTPVTAWGRVVGSVLILSSVVLVSLFTATASSLLVARRIKEGDALDAETLTGHTVVCGWNRNMPRFLTALSHTGERVVVLVNEAPNDVIEPHLKAYANLKILFVRGSFTQESLLLSAGIKSAAHCVIVPDESGSATEGEGDEQKTVLTSLIVKEMNPEIRVYVHVQHREDAAHVKRAKADEVIVSDEFTGELLANHVAHPGAPQALAELMSFDTTHALKAVDIAPDYIGSTVGSYAQFLRDSMNQLLIGFAVREEGFGLSQAMSGGSDYITEFIQQQVQQAGISLSTDERIVVRLNPPQDYVIGPKHSALVMT